jgi:hypothetical protein
MRYLHGVFLLACGICGVHRAEAVRPMITANLADIIYLVGKGKTVTIRTNAAQKLATLAHDMPQKDISHETLTAIITLMDSPEDSVRYWIARSIGNLGNRGKIAIPKLKESLVLADCLPGTKTSASGIRFALSQLDVAQPPHADCERS